MVERARLRVWFLGPIVAAAALAWFAVPVPRGEPGPTAPMSYWPAAKSAGGARTPAGPESEGILTFRGDNARTGWNPAERTLTPDAIRSRSLHRVWAVQVEGEIYGEPLVVPRVSVRGQARTVVYVVTERDLVYAFDALDGARIWGPVSLGTPVPRAALPCGNIDPSGITGTPVADRATSSLYVVGQTTPDDGRTRTYKIAALSLDAGAMRPGWPVEIAPPPSNGLRFDARAQQQRSALTLLHGVVYVPFGGYFGDCGDYHGWIVGVPVQSPDRQEAYATPTRRMGGIWATGGMAADGEGRLYAGTGNSDSNGTVDFGESVIRLATLPRLAFSGERRDFFTPSNYVALNNGDVDLGSAAPLVLPPFPDSATPHLVFAAGKQGVGYLINADDMGGVSRGDGVNGEGVFSRCLFAGCRGRPVVFSALAYWDAGRAGRLIVVPGRGEQPAPCRGNGGLVALRLGTAPGSRAARFEVAWCSGPSMRDPGAPAISSAGSDGGVAWVVDTGTAVLYALDARTGGELYASRGADALAGAHRFIAPAVLDGRVYVGAGHEVAAFGLR